MKDPVKEYKDKAIEWEKIFVSPISDKTLVSRKYKGPSKHNGEKQTIQLD